jgi:two-component system response regulator NreC
MSEIRVLLADDHAILRDGLQAMLTGHPEIRVVGQASDGLEAIRHARDLQPDVVVMDIGMPRVNGLEASRRILKECPACRILILSQYDDSDHVLDALVAGVSGYLLKRTAGSELVPAIEAIVGGGVVLDPLAARILLDAYLQCELAERQDSYEHLTDREREVLILVAEGYTNQQIAQLLHVSPKTVNAHRTKLMSKLDLHDRTEVAKYALRKQLIDL